MKTVHSLVLICLSAFLTGETSAVLRDPVEHLRAFMHNPAQVGAVAPCSSYAVKELTKYIAQHIRNDGAPLHILEPGSGTGVVSREIIGLLRECDTVDLVEISPELCADLHTQFDAYANVSINCMSILDWHPAYQYDFIICTLPFTSLDADLVEKVIAYFQLILKPGGVLSYIAYVGLAEMKTYILWGKKRALHRKKISILKDFRDQYLIEEHIVVLNCPPTHVYHLQMGEAVK